MLGLRPNTKLSIF
uniref:Uncharacterized protein n=1 Tax=Arundo donax TaxID=35708 RepID=A0A0A9FFG8_ARUDO